MWKQVWKCDWAWVHQHPLAGMIMALSRHAIVFIVTPMHNLLANLHVHCALSRQPHFHPFPRLPLAPAKVLQQLHHLSTVLPYLISGDFQATFTPLPTPTHYPRRCSSNPTTGLLIWAPWWRSACPRCATAPTPTATTRCTSMRHSWRGLKQSWRSTRTSKQAGRKRTIIPIGESGAGCKACTSRSAAAGLTLQY